MAFYLEDGLLCGQNRLLSGHEGPYMDRLGSYVDMVGFYLDRWVLVCQCLDIWPFIWKMGFYMDSVVFCVDMVGPYVDSVGLYLNTWFLIIQCGPLFGQDGLL